jgi:hypothetical protein
LDFSVSDSSIFFFGLVLADPNPSAIVDADDDSRGLNMGEKLPLALCLLTLAVVSFVASSLWLMSGFGLMRDNRPAADATAQG